MTFFAEMELLSRIRWQFFGSLTFRHSFLRTYAGGKAERVRLCRWHAFGRDVAKNLFYIEKNWSKILWALRLEQGEHGDNCWHNHFLMSGLPNGTVNPTSCESMKAWWRQLGGGHPSVRVYEAQLNGAEYVAKCMSLADLYEARKFGEASHLTLSSSFWRVVRAQDLVAARRLAKLEKNTQERLADGAGVSRMAVRPGTSIMLPASQAARVSVAYGSFERIPTRDSHPTRRYAAGEVGDLKINYAFMVSMQTSHPLKMMLRKASWGVEGNGLHDSQDARWSTGKWGAQSNGAAIDAARIEGVQRVSWCEAGQESRGRGGIRGLDWLFMSVAGMM